VSFPERCYQTLLYLYPASFRREYGEPMQQAFRDQLRHAGNGPKHGLWTRAAVDLLRSAAALHAAEWRRRGSGLLAGVFWLAAAIFLGRYDLHTDDTGIEVALILLFTFVLGFWHPKRAVAASLLGLSIPLAELIAGNHAPGLALIAVFVTAAGAIGGCSGVFLRRALTGNEPR